MSQKPNPTVIGLFIVLGLFLAVACIVVFGKSKLFADTNKYILYFDASVEGLGSGAPVKFRGVTIGSVSEVLIRHNQAEDDLFIPVIIEISEDLLREKSDRSIGMADPEKFDALVEKGLRGRLEAQSLVTGLLYVDLEINPDAPQPVFHQLKPQYREIPTLPTQIQELLTNLASLDVKGITDKLNRILDQLGTSLGELQVQEINDGLTNLLGSLNTLVHSPKVTNSLDALQVTLAEYQGLARKLSGRIDPLADDATGTLEEARASLVEIRQGFEDIRDLIAPHAPLRKDLLQAVDQLGRAARSIAELADFLTRHPNAVLRGRESQETP